jgi:hypothetical protein
MVNVTNRADIRVRLRALKLFLGHLFISDLLLAASPSGQSVVSFSQKLGSGYRDAAP